MKATYMIVDGKPFGKVSAFEINDGIGRTAYVLSLEAARKACDLINKRGVSLSKVLWMV